MQHHQLRHDVRNRDRRDDGVTLVELVVVVVIIGLLTTVIAAAVSVVYRSDSAVSTVVGESHDTQQLVNYFPLDVQSGTDVAADFFTLDGGAHGDPGSGCSDIGNDNVLRIDLADRRIAYRLVITPDDAELDRYDCRLAGLVWEEVSVVNIADSLDTTAAEIVSTSLVVDDPLATDPEEQRVRLVRLQYSHTRELRSIQAAPRVEPLSASAGECGSDPLSATRAMDTFVEADVHLHGTNVKSTLGVGGSLSFEGTGSRVASASVGQIPQVAGHENVYLFAGSINWGASENTLDLNSGDAMIFDGNFDLQPQGSNWRLVDPTFASSATVRLSNPPILAPAPPPIDFGEAFVELQACSDLLASLPAGCDFACAEHVGLITTSGGAYPGTAGDPDPTLVLVDGKANVLNIPEANLAQLDSIKFEAIKPAQTIPLVINVASGASITFTPPQIQAAGNLPIYIIWNFPNATSVSIVGSTLRGTVFAPYATVTSTQSIEGGVVARRFVMSGSSLNDVRAFDGFFSW